MRIAIDAFGIGPHGGGRTSIVNLLTSIFKVDNKNQYLVFLNQYEPTFEGFGDSVCQKVIPIKNRFLVRLAAQIIFPTMARNYDLVHFTKNLGVFGPIPPSIVTIHDMTTILYPNLVTWSDYWYWRTVQKLTVRKAKRIITVSHDAAKDIEKIYLVPKDKIRVVHHGCSEIFQPSGIDQIEKTLKVYNLKQPYILHVGRIDRKKNLTTLVEAFNQLRCTGFSGKLVLAGEEYRKSPDHSLRPTIKRLHLEDEIVFTGKVPDIHLPHIYSGAMICVFPSIHEGFGLVALESMKCGVPVIAQRAGAVAEVVRDSGIILDSLNSFSLAEAMQKLVKDKDLRHLFHDRGLARAMDFSWEKAAQETLKIYSEIA